MKGKIPKQFINELLNKTNIIEFIGSRIKLKKIGQYYQSLCPFHQEKTPSFIVNKEKQFFYCFGCNTHGNVIDFLILYENINFLESIEELSILHGIKIPYEKTNLINEKKYRLKNNLYKILKDISKIYINNLYSLKNNPAILYLKKRNILEKTIKKFSIGYTGYSSKTIVLELRKKKINDSILIKTGLVITDTKKNFFDRFQERIIFPIKDKYGRINGFGGRIYKKNTNLPKYINSPETPIFHKKKNLYGIYQLYKDNKIIKKIIIVEGYLDVITLFQYNIKNSVGLLGTVLTINHLEILFNISNHLIFCFDGDKAGLRANWESLKLSLIFLKDNRKINFIFLPKNEDPNSILEKKGRIYFKKKIKNAMSLHDFFFQKISKNLNLCNLNDCIKLSILSIPLIHKIPGTITKIIFRKTLGQKIGILEEQELKRLILIKKEENNLTPIKPIKINLIRLLISLLIQNPKLIKNIHSIENLEKINIPGIKIFIKLIKIYKKNSKTKISHIIEYFRNTKIESSIRKLAFWNNMINTKNTKIIFLQLLKNLKIQELENKYSILLDKEKKIGLTLDEKKKLWKINKKMIEN